MTNATPNRKEHLTRKEACERFHLTPHEEEMLETLRWIRPHTAEGGGTALLRASEVAAAIETWGGRMDALCRVERSQPRQDDDGNERRHLLLTSLNELANERAMLSPNFTLMELVASAAATQQGIDNLPGLRELDNLRALCTQLLQKVRDAWGAPIAVTSGYRCPRLNALVGGAANSQHMAGQAADIVAVAERSVAARPSQKARMRALFELIKKNFCYDQLIWERGGQWIHLSYVSHDRNRQAVLKWS